MTFIRKRNLNFFLIVCPWEYYWNTVKCLPDHSHVINTICKIDLIFIKKFALRKMLHKNSLWGSLCYIAWCRMEQMHKC